MTTSPSSIDRTGTLHRRWPGYAWFMVLWALASGALIPGPAAASSLRENAKIKASYLLNFAKLVEWPADRSGEKESNFLIGLHGDPYLWKASRRGLAGKKVDGERIQVKSLSLEDAMDPPPGMKILYITGSEPDELKKLVAALADRPVVLIGDSPGFCDLGGTIGLLERDGRILFEINRTHELHNGYRINSRLLRIADRLLGGTTAAAVRTPSQP